MRQSRLAVIVVVCILSFAALISKLCNIITVDYEDLAKRTEFKQSHDPSLVLADSPDHMIWFVQVSLFSFYTLLPDTISICKGNGIIF